MSGVEDPKPSRQAGRNPKRSRTSGVVVPHTPRWYQRLAAAMIYLTWRIYTLTLRIRWDEPSRRLRAQIQGPVIYCLWHNRLLLCFKAYEEHRKNHGIDKGVAALISASRDGAFLAAIVECFGMQPVRGSSSRRGPQALLELTSWAERGYSLAITPDGPRGPCYRVQEGVMSVAQLTGLPIVPFSFHAHSKIRLKSWDRFQVPLPFSRCDLSIAKPVHIPRDITDSQREEVRKQLEETLKNISKD
jgi:lysophospholipid acyltransferase (LPLAT)-like uncharacterized protein